MKISLEWLRQYLPQAPDAAACGEALTHAGLPVEVFEKHGTDDVFDVEVTSNRADCLSHIGVARELSALLNLPLTEPQPKAVETTEAASGAISVAIEATDLCSHFTARIIRGARIAPSPAWLARRLEAIGQRPVNNVVDVTNYVLFEMGQPLHAFDYDKIAQRKIIVRCARPNEKLTSLDGHERALDEKMLVIADAEKASSVAGVMGGLHSEVSNSTTNILLEAARFDPLSIRRTARKLTLRSESSYRFERGLDPLLAEKASLRAAELILQTAGGTLLNGLVRAGTPNWAPKNLTVRLERLSRLLGMEVPREKAVDALRRLRLNPQSQGDSITCTIPSDRLDLNIEVDLIEEIARVIGYSQIPVRDTISIRLKPREPHEVAMAKVHEAAVGAGYHESITFSFVSDLLAEDFLPGASTGLPRADHGVRKADGRLRPSLIPGLLEAVRRNENVGNDAVRLYEGGSAFWLDAEGKLTEKRVLCLVGDSDLRATRGAVESILRRMDTHRPIDFRTANHKGFSIAADVLWDNHPIGNLGLINPTITEKLGLRATPSAAELDLTALLKQAQLVPKLKPLPRHPAIRRDLSLVLTEQTPYAQVESAVHELNIPLLESVQYVTTYRGKPLEKGQKSVTIELILRKPDGTLTGEEADSAVAKVTETAKSRLGAVLRV